MDDFLTPAEVARKLRVKPATVYQYLRSGELPGIRLAKSWLIDPTDLEQFLEEHKRGGRADE